MKKKLFLGFVMTVVFALALTLAVSAEGTVHNENTVDYSETVTLNDGTVLPLFDENKEALIWYISGVDAEGKTAYTSIRTDDQRVKWNTETWDEVTGINIVLDETKTINKTKMVVVNMMDDDVVKNAGPGTTHYGKPVTGFKFLFNYSSTLEYVYLRLDTTNVQKESFTNCVNLKYVNLESLTELVRIGDSNNFAGCTSLFKGQVLDLSKTKIWSIDWSNAFKGVPIIGIKLPSTITRFGSHFENSGLVSISFPANITTVGGNMFKNCVSLTTVCLNKVTAIEKDAFYGCSNLNTVFFVGSCEELNALLDATISTGNEAFLAVAGENRKNLISYADYMKLSDKSGKYMVYNYSWCEAYNDGAHETTTVNDCVGFCNVCLNNIVNHSENAGLSVRLEYTDYLKAGTEISCCTNDGCTYTSSVEINALFRTLGYSVKETNGYGIVQGFLIDKEAYNSYVATREGFEIGVVVSTVANPLDENGNVVNEKKTIKADIMAINDAFEVIVKNIGEANLDRGIICCGYVIDNGEVYYINNGETVKSPELKSYNELKEILG